LDPDGQAALPAVPLGWGSVTTLVTLAVALVLLAGFAAVETRVRDRCEFRDHERRPHGHSGR
jgi:hypothetical protein